MQPDRFDSALLWDMLQYARRVASMTETKTWDDYQRDEMLRFAVERCVSIIGEAANKVSVAFQDAHPEIAWRPIITQRHRLIHEYGGVRHDLIWAVASTHVPELIRLVEPILPTPPADPEPESS